MTMGLACLLATGLVWAGPALVEPKVRDRVYEVSGPGEPRALPYEKVVQKGKSKGRVARLAGGRSEFRISQGEEPVLVIAYTARNVRTSSARLYLMETDGKERKVTLGLWGVSNARVKTPGALPLRMEKYGKVSIRLLLPAGLAPGEYAISDRPGAAAFTFGIDGN